MKEIYFEITQWPAGKSLDVADNDGYSITIAGVHGGGVGKTIKRFKVNIDFLKDAISEICGEEEE